MKKSLSRRDFLRVLKKLVLSFFAVVGGTYYYGAFIEPDSIEVVNIDIPLPRLPKNFSGYRIVQISDIHIGGWMNRERLSVVVRLVKEQKPDLILMTGDYVLGHSWSAELDQAAIDFASEMSLLTAEYTVIGVMGNHDHWTDPFKVRKMLSQCSVIELRNDVYPIERDGAHLYIAGVDDVYVGKQNLGQVVSQLPGDGAAILLAHEPDFVKETASYGKFDLQLSGHSHGGQVVLPFFGPPVLPHLGMNYPSGLYWVGSMWQYTNRGVGMTSPFVRLNCPPEITVITLRNMD